MYRIALDPLAKKQLGILYKSDKKSYEKAIKMIDEITENPRMGTGHPERLKGQEGEVWSRRINKKDRLVYEIFDEIILVNVVSAMGHYGDK